MNFAVHLDGLSLLFASLITGIGALVVLYSITYLSKSESLGNFYCYLLIILKLENTTVSIFQNFCVIFKYEETRKNI